MCFFRKKQEPVEIKPSHPSWYRKALRELNIREIEGKKHNPRIIEYHKETTLKAKTDESSWCSSFVNWCFARTGILGTKSAAARSWLNWGRVLERPKVGCVVVFWRVRLSGWQGHVAFFVREDSESIWVLGGNQNNSVSIAKYPKSRLLGYRWPDQNSYADMV